MICVRDTSATLSGTCPGLFHTVHRRHYVFLKCSKFNKYKPIRPMTKFYQKAAKEA